MGWTFEPGQLVPIAVVGAFYGRRAWTLRRRGRPVLAWKLASFGGGLLLLLAAVVTPIDSIGEERLFSVHM
ncbi:MAG TPA: cytochrome c oxidase assembly protein, partial [Gaiellaceae bacterium]|nr:cytochrome c oxidase assembly protein [Gaiellaceae bacterium]